MHIAKLNGMQNVLEVQYKGIVVDHIIIFVGWTTKTT